MQLVTCKNPQRVYNKYIDDYVFVPCGKCSVCRNRRAAHYNQLLESERLQHRYTFFVTLTYADEFVPHISFGDFCGEKVVNQDTIFYSNRRDFNCISFNEIFPPEGFGVEYQQADIDYFKSLILHGHVPYASKTDCQLFFKRLNKYFFDNVTHKFKNFRYFLVSEYGSTTFRPHFHAIFFVDNYRCAEKFKDGVSACWKFGRVDCQFVENSACGYVSQYLNKSSDLPYVYENRNLRPFFLCSRNPYIGALPKCTEDDKKIFDTCPCEISVRKTSRDIKFVNVPLPEGYQNRIFPKCCCYSTINDTLRIEFYRCCERFGFESLNQFLSNVYDYITGLSKEEFCLYLRQKCVFSAVKVQYFRHLTWQLFDGKTYNFLRRLYYISKKVARQACHFGVSIMTYINRIFEYYNKKELYFLRRQYEFQEVVAKSECDSISCMYLGWLHDAGYSLSDYISIYSPPSIIRYFADCDIWSKSNKKTHFKNAYLDSLALKRDSVFLYNLIKSFLYAKKCNETLEAFAT